MTVLLAASFLVQLCAAVLALRLVQRTRTLFPWLLISFALFLMAVRQGIALAQRYYAFPDAYRGLYSEIAFLCISCLLLAGIIILGKTIEERRHARRAAAEQVKERRKVEKALLRSEDRFQNLFENAVTGLYRTTPDWRIVMANPALVRMLGYESFEELSKESLEESVFDAAHPRSVFKQKIEKEGQVSGFESALLRKDGTRLYVRESARATRDRAGKTLYYEGTMEDITESKRLEKQMYGMQKLEAIGQLAGGIAHDFNNMLMAIRGYAELAVEDMPADSKAAQDLEEISKVTDRAASLTRKILAFSRRQVLERRVVDLNEIVRNMEGMIRRLIGEHIAVKMSLAPDLKPAELDPSQIEQVVLNLAVNARDAMPQGGELALRTENAELDEDVKKAHPFVVPGEHVLLSVTDTGWGIPQEIQDRIFEPFFTTKEKGKGTGMGLSTCYGIIKQHGGYIWMYSEMGKGSVFKVYLPVAGRDAEDRVEPAAEPSLTLLRGTETLLIVEDDSSVLDVIKRNLGGLGYYVIGASSGEEAKKAIVACPRTVDLLVTDVVMPGMGGRTLARDVRDVYPEVKVIFMSGFSEDAVQLDGLLEPGADFLQKPFVPEVLARKVREVLDAT
jgi:PAS domain S-box-containing protein